MEPSVSTKTAWQEVAELDLTGRPFHRQEAGCEIYGMMGRLKVRGDSLQIMDDVGRKIAAGSVESGSCRIKDDGTIEISIYMIGSVLIFPYGAYLKPA